MGLGLAQQLLQLGHTVTIYNRNDILSAEII